MALNWNKVSNTKTNITNKNGLDWSKINNNSPTQTSATPTFKTVDEALEYAKANNINVSNSSVENAKKAENANKLKNEIPEENIIEMKRKGIGDVIGDVAENLWVNTLGGTANTINALNSVNEKLAGRDTTSIDAQNLLDYKNNNQKWYQPAIDAYRNIGSFVNPLTKNITSATSFGQTPNSAYSRLEQIYKANPNNLKLKRLYEAIRNGTYTGTKEELQKELNDVQISLYNEFVDKYTRDEAEAVAKRHQRNKDEYGAFGEMAMNAFGQVGNMVPSMLTSVIAPPVGMTTLGLNAGGNAMGQAINEGAGYNEAMTYGTLSGLAEAGIETISGGLSNRLMNVKGIFNPSNLTSKIGNKFLRGTANTVLDITGEGLEEVVAAFIDPILQRLTYDPNAPMATGEELWLSFRDSILPTLLMQGGGVALNKVNEYHTKQVEKIRNSNLPQDKKTELINETTSEKDKIVNEIQNAQQPVQNVALQSPNNQVQQQTNEIIPQQTENQQNANMVQNNTQIAQNIPNNVQISQNNMQNAQDLQKTGQLPLHIQTFVDNRAITSPGLTVMANETLTSDGMIEKRADGTRVIKINPKSTRAYEFVVVHEMMHDLEGTQEFQELSKYVKNRAISHNEFESAKKAITEQYTKYYTENNLDMSGLNMDVETTNDMVARALGNQEFLNELAGQKPNVFMRIYNWIKNVAFDGNKTGKTFSERIADNKYLQELKNKFETAYNTSYKGNAKEQYSLKGRDKNGYPIYESDLMQEIANKEKIKHLEKQMEVLKGKPLFFNINGQKIKAYFDDYGVQKTTYGTVKGDKAETRKGFQTKEMLATDLYTIINNSKFVSETDEISNITNTLPKNKAHQDVRKWYTFENKINYKGEIYTVLTTVRKKDDGNYGYSVKFYENKKNNSVQAYSLENFRDNTHSSYINSIPSNNNVVNNQYMQNGSNNTQNSTQSSFSLGDLEAFENKKQEAYKKIADEFGRGANFWEVNLEGLEKESAIRMLKRDTGVQNRFIETHDFEKVYKPVSYRTLITAQTQNFVKENNVSFEELVNNEELTKKFFDVWGKELISMGDSLESAKQTINMWKDYFEAQRYKYIKKEGTMRILKSFESDFNKILSGATQEVDNFETSKKLEKMETFDKYVESFVKPLYGEKPKLSKEELTELAQDTFGITTDFSVGAYMTLDGKLLNFRDGRSQYRNDHRDIDTIGYNMQEFIDAGNIRMKPEGNGFELAQEPTAEQYETLSEYIDSLDGEVYIEIDLGKNKYDGANYKKGTSTNKIISDLQYYFKNGKFPNKSQFADFRYSQSNKEWQKYLDKNWDLMPNTTKTFGLPSVEQLQARDLKQGEEISNTLNMKKQEDGLKEAIDNVSKNDKANKVSYTTDFYRNMRNALGEKAGRELTGMFDNQKLAYVKFKQKFANELKRYVVDKLGIKPGSEMSADVQRFGEKIITEAELKTKYPNNWQNIVEADKWFRAKYNELIDAINATREDIYPNVEEQVQQTKESLLKTYDLIKEAEKTGIAPYKVDQDIQDNIKRLEERIESKKEKIKEIEDANRPNYRKTKKYNSLIEQLQQLEQNKNELERTLGTRYDEKVARLKKRAQRLSDTLNSEELWRGKRIPKRDNYYRHFQEMAEGFKALHNIFETPAEISSQLAGTSEYTKPNAKFLGLAQKRTTNETEYDAVKGFLNYLEPASYAINIDPFTANLRAITKTIKENTVYTKNANKLIEYLDDFTNSLAGKTNPFDRLPQKLTSRKTMKAIEWMGNRIKSNAVLGNINSSISQILNLPQVVGKIKNPVKLAQGLTDLASGKGKYQDSQFIQERYHSDIDSQFKTKLLQQPKKFATWMLGALDETVTKTGWNAVYRQAIEKGIDNPIQYADDTMRDLVAGRGIGERSLAQESKLVNLLMPFTVETGNYWRVMKDFVKEKDFGGILITYIVGWLINRGIEALGASGKTFDPIDAIYDAITEEDISILERVGRVGGEFLSSMPFGQQLAAIYPEYGADLGVFKLPGREDLFGSNDPTRFGTGSMFTNIFEHPVTSLAMPWGGTQLRRTLEGAEALLKGGDYKTNSKGEEQLKFPVDLSELEPNEKMLKAIQVLTLGKYATPEAQNYFDNGALSVVQTKGLKEAQKLGISSKKFYEIRDKIKAIEVPTRKNKEGKDEAIPGARKKLIIEELNKTDLNSEQKKLFYDIFYSQELK